MKRRCYRCQYEGNMETWFTDKWLPYIIVILGFCFYMVPGIIFWVYAYGKYRCPACGSIGKNTTFLNNKQSEKPDTGKDNFVDLKQGIYGNVKPEFSGDYFYSQG